jgi:hypothetical protein
MSNFERSYSTVYSAAELWQALNTPLSPEISEQVNPYADWRYANLTEAGLIGSGTELSFVLHKEKIAKAAFYPKKFMPDDIDFLVTSHDDEAKSRTDTLQSEKAVGQVHFQVDAVGWGSQLLVQSELSVSSKTIIPFGSMITDEVIHYGVGVQTERLLKHHVPAVLR